MIVPTVAVTEHAIDRYLERVEGLDPAIATADDRALARRAISDIAGVTAALGGSIIVRDGHAYIISGYTVVTVLPKGARAKKSGLRRARYAVAGDGARP